jgi:predicted NBD/HSP70 family sugar kinase
MTYVLFDIGGTKTRVTISEDLETFADVESFKTPAKFEEGIEKMCTAIKKLTDKPITAIAGGVRGLLTEEKDGIQNDAILSKWVGKNIIKKLSVFGDVPIFLENDTAIAGVGEAMYGAGREAEIVAYHTISTGVGGVKIENGEIDHASNGFEPGHQILDIDRTILGEDITPTLENLVSGTALAERFGVKAYEIPQSDVVWDELADYLAQGLRNTILYWSPDVIVLGGSMIVGDPAISVDAIRKYTVETIDSFVETPLITKAELGDHAGLYGAMGILKQRL